MEIKIGIAKTKKYAVSHSGDCCEIAERPHGGISAVLADGQGSGLSAHHTSSWVVNKAVSLIMDGARDGAVARAVHGTNLWAGIVDGTAYTRAYAGRRLSAWQRCAV